MILLYCHLYIIDCIYKGLIHYYYYFFQDKYGETALILACMFGHKAVAELLIQKGANVNYQDKVKLICMHAFPCRKLETILLANKMTIIVKDRQLVVKYVFLLSDWFHSTTLRKQKWPLRSCENVD